VIERVVVTGAAGGVGAACVRAFHELGAEVVGVDITKTSTADDHMVLDLGDPDCGQLLADHVGDRPVDILVNNAAVGHARLAVETDIEEFDRIIAINLRAPFLLAVALLPTLRDRSGSVVNVSSVHAVATSSPVSVYAASKGGLVALTRALALEWAPEVRVNCVLPGGVDTEMLADGLSRANASLEEFALKQPLMRVGQPVEIAEAIVFLATNRFTTGASLVVDGGASARLSTE
jgi:NAD(P)-dependent dehydrogenase (short-subunit alcohol dehydrogenase family)